MGAKRLQKKENAEYKKEHAMIIHDIDSLKSAIQAAKMNDDDDGRLTTDDWRPTIDDRRPTTMRTTTKSAIEALTKGDRRR